MNIQKLILFTLELKNSERNLINLTIENNFNWLK